MKCFDCGKKVIKYKVEDAYNHWYCTGCGLMWATDKELDVKRFQRAGDTSCTHIVGLYKSGRCRVCGFQVMDNIRKRARELGLTRLLKIYGNERL